MKEIKLTQGKVALVDDEDYDMLIKYKWNANIVRKTDKFYAYSHYSCKSFKISMHNLIMKSKSIDHKALELYGEFALLNNLTL